MRRRAQGRRRLRCPSRRGMPTVDGQSVISRWGRKGNPDKRSRFDRDGLAGKEILKRFGAAPSELVARLRSQPSCALRCDRRVIDRRNVRRGDVELAPVISAPASPDPEGALSRGRVRKPDATVPVVVGGPVGQTFSPPGMTVGTPGAVLARATCLRWPSYVVEISIPLHRRMFGTSGA